MSSCLKLEPSKTAYYTFISFALFFCPIGVMIFAYAILMRKVWSSHMPGNQQDHNHVIHSKSKSKVIFTTRCFLSSELKNNHFVQWKANQTLRVKCGVADRMLLSEWINHVRSALIIWNINGRWNQEWKISPSHYEIDRKKLIAVTSSSLSGLVMYSGDGPLFLSFTLAYAK